MFSVVVCIYEIHVFVEEVFTDGNGCFVYCNVPCFGILFLEETIFGLLSFCSLFIHLS